MILCYIIQKIQSSILAKWMDFLAALQMLNMN